VVSVAGTLRYFLYRDDAIVSQYLEQLEGGGYDEESIRRQAGRGGTASADLRAGPVGLQAGGSRSSEEQSELNLRQTGPSRFSRFYQLANDGDGIQSVDAIDDAIWDQIATGEIIEASVTVVVPDVVKSLAAIGPIASLLPALEAFAPFATDEEGKPSIDPDDLAKIKQQMPPVQQVVAATADRPFTVSAALVSDPRFKFGMRVKREFVLDSIEALEGECRVLASLQSKATRDRPLQVEEFPGLVPQQSRQQRRRKDATANRGIVLRYPSAIVSPIALFR
jgi:hypothetical protein